MPTKREAIQALQAEFLALITQTVTYAGNPAFREMVDAYCARAPEDVYLDTQQQRWVTPTMARDYLLSFYELELSGEQECALLDILGRIRNECDLIEPSTA